MSVGVTYEIPIFSLKPKKTSRREDMNCDFVSDLITERVMLDLEKQRLELEQLRRSIESANNGEAEDYAVNQADDW